MDAVAGAAALRAMALGAAVTRRLETTYWDTPDFAFRDAGIALRVRTTDGGAPLLSLKADRGHALARDEVESSLETERPDLGRLVEAGWSPRRSLIGRADDLLPVFASKVTRRAQRIAFRDGTVAELAFDHGELRTLGTEPITERVRELEIELVEGDVRRVYELAVALVGEFPDLRLLFASKAERAQRLVTGTPAPARHARKVALGAKMPAGMVAVEAAAEALAQLAANVEGARQGQHSAYVHQMRIGLRRYRIALSLARAAGLPQPSQALRSEVEAVWDLLGSMRDWDVFEQEIWPTIRPEAEALPEAGTLDATLARERAMRHAALRTALDGTRFQETLLVALWALENQREHALREPARRARSLARKVLRKRHKRVHRRAGKLTSLAPADRHRLRIDAKKLRYTAEFCGDLFPKPAVKRYLRRLSAVQSTLGALHDLETFPDLVAAAAEAWPVRVREAIEATRQAHATDRRKRLSRGLLRDWRRFDEVKAFWK